MRRIVKSLQGTESFNMVTQELDMAMDTLFPSEIGAGSVAATEGAGATPSSEANSTHRIRARRAAYVQAIAGEALFDLATKHDLVITVHCAPGSFLRKGQLLATATPSSLSADARGITKSLDSAFILGDHRTGTKDIEFLFLQLVEVAARALSPGINDPFTAILCLDRLSAALANLVRRDLPAPVRRDEQGMARVVAPSPSFPAILELSLGEIIHYGGSDPMVAARLFALIDTVGDCAPATEQRDALRYQAERVYITATMAAGKDDARVSAIAEQYHATLRRLKQEPQGAH